MSKNAIAINKIQFFAPNKATYQFVRMKHKLNIIGFIQINKSSLINVIVRCTFDLYRSKSSSHIRKCTFFLPLVLLSRLN